MKYVDKFVSLSQFVVVKAARLSIFADPDVVVLCVFSSVPGVKKKACFVLSLFINPDRKGQSCLSRPRLLLSLIYSL